MDQAGIDALRDRVKAQLGHVDGLVHVSVGLKEVNGRATDEVAIRIYVAEKKPLEQIPPGQRIPAEIEGWRTDVVRVARAELLHCEDIAQHDPLIGGISITTFRGGAGAGAGTLGFFATINGKEPPENVVLVTNNHIIAAQGEAVDDTVYQPRFVVQPDGTIPMDATPERKNPIAKIHKLGQQASHSFAYPGEGAKNYYLDCGSAQLDISISSWCHTNCGVSYKNEIRELNIAGNSKVADIARVKAADVTAAGTAGLIVYKVGRTTGRTKGKVVDAEAPGDDGGLIMLIEPVEANCNGDMVFADHGDSGAAILDATNKIVGLLYARNTANLVQIMASHVHPVLDLLGLTAVSTAHPPVPPAGQARLDMRGAFEDDLDAIFPVRAHLLGTARGAELHARACLHREEVVGLVNRCRPVTVAWHRAKGPHFLNHLVANLRDAGHRVPREIDGVSREQVIARMAGALRAHGSERLRAAIDTHFDEALGIAATLEDMRDLAARFERESGDAGHGAE